MTMTDLWNGFLAGPAPGGAAGWAGWCIGISIALMSLVQVSPLKLNPWDRVFAWLGKKMYGQVDGEIKYLRGKVCDLWVTSHRQSILNFARECREEVHHDPEEWATILTIAEEYEDHCKRHGTANGVVRENTRYIRELYQELAREIGRAHV